MTYLYGKTQRFIHLGHLTLQHTNFGIFGLYGVKRNSVVMQSRAFVTVTPSCRYIHFVKGYFRPTLTKEAESVISRYYQLQRRSGTENAGLCLPSQLFLCCYLIASCLISFSGCSKDHCSNAREFNPTCSRYNF